MQKSLLKLKIEKIAKNLLIKNQNELNNININKKTELNLNQFSSEESTIKESISEFEEISKAISFNNQNGLNNNNNSIKNNKKTNFKKSRNQSSLCTKMTALTENNSKRGTFDYNSNYDDNKMNINIKNKNIIEKNESKSKELFIKNLIDNDIKNINLDVLNNLINIYKNLLDLLEFNKYKFYKNNIKNEDLNKEIENKNNEIKILSYKYINFIFSVDMELLIKLFYNNIEINKYFISQIYLFISIIYLYEQNIFSNSYLLISYKSIIFYSLQNLQNILNIINLPELFQNEKLLNNIKSINKIIFSILVIINPNVPSNSQIIDFISPNKNRKNDDEGNIIDNNDIKSSGLFKLILLLKENSNLNEKLSIIQKILDKEKKNKKSYVDIYEERYINNNKSNNNNVKFEENNDDKEAIGKNILPPMDTKRYKYTIAIELDETLVHYCEEGENYYAKVRFGSENFLKEISNCFEIIVISTSGKDYSNIIIDNINKEKCYIVHRIYSEDFIEGLNLLNINRDIKKLIYICHDYNFFNAPKENIILLKEFNGEEEDREIIKLYNELKLLINNNNIKKDFDIRNIIPEIMQRISLNIDYVDYPEEEGKEEYDNEER